MEPRLTDWGWWPESVGILGVRGSAEDPIKVQ